MKTPSLPPVRFPIVLQPLCSRSSGRFQRHRKTLSNEAELSEKIEGISNDFQPLQGDWVQLSPYGQFPHPRGMQYFAKNDAVTVVNDFNSLKAKLMRRWAGLPWYEGHPDTSPRDYPNKKAFGWIDNLEARDDGLYGHVKWTKAGNELINEGHYKYFSPVWDAVPASVGGKPVLRPDHLISVGFTNTPNMPVLPLSNEQEEQQQQQKQKIENIMTVPPFLKKFLGFNETDEPNDEAIETAAQKKSEEFENSKKKIAENEEAAPAAAALANEKTQLETALENEKKSVKNLSEQLDKTAKAVDAERHERIELLVATHLANGKITKGDADKWRTELKEDFAGKSVELANVKPALSNEVLTKDLGRHQSHLEQGATPGEQLRALANEKVANKETPDFGKAWQLAKKQRPDLAEAMKPKGKAA
jgi:phage I-like protein